MKIISANSPVTFADGQAVAPELINRCFNYAAAALDEVSEKRFSIFPILFPFVDDVNNGLTNASPTTLRTYRFVCPANCIVLRAFVDANITASARVDVDITLAGSATRPTGATTPYLSLPSPLVLATDVNDINVQRVQLVAGVVYDVAISGTSYTTGRCDVTLLVAVDRWSLSGSADIPSFTPTQQKDQVADASIIGAAGNVGALTTATAKLTARGMACVMVWARNFHSTTTTDLLTFALPAFFATRTNARIIRAYLTSSATAAGTVTMTMKNAAAATVLTMSSAVTTLNTVDSGVISISLLTGSPALSTDDFTVAFTATQVSPQVSPRTALLLWIEW